MAAHDQDDVDDTSLSPLGEFGRNVEYALDLVRGGRYLERLKVGAFDVTDLYRAAWMQAVAALDHWVHREVYARAVGFAMNPSVPRPDRWSKIAVPMSTLEAVMQNKADLAEQFTDILRDQFGHLSFQNPANIKQAFAYVCSTPLWPAVAKEMGQGATATSVQERLKEIVWRRNRIAHETDIDASTGARRPITDADVTDALEWIQQLATAIHAVIGPPPPVPSPSPATKRKWDRKDIDDALTGPAAEVVEALLAHADAHGAQFKGGTSAEPNGALHYVIAGKRRSLWSIWFTGGRPSIVLSLASLTWADPALSLAVVQALRTHPALDAALLHDDDTIIQKYPAIDLNTVALADNATTHLISALDAALAYKSETPTEADAQHD
ncbi:hypothetical protein [Actinokineospora sp. NPDC004072]